MPKRYQHKESELQIQCVRWFAYEYPHLRMRLYHPKNEGTANGRVQGAIAKAEGVVAGVADLMLQLPSDNGYSCLAIEMKTPTGRQSPEQKLFEKYITAADGKYVVVRSFDDFKAVVMKYVGGVYPDTLRALRNIYKAQQEAENEKARQRMRKLINAEK